MSQFSSKQMLTHIPCWQIFIGGFVSIIEGLIEILCLGFIHVNLGYHWTMYCSRLRHKEQSNDR